MHKIVITGCAGFIGSHLTEQLLEMGFQVTGIDNFDPFYAKSVKKDNLSGFILHPNVKFLEIDLTNRNAL